MNTRRLEKTRLQTQEPQNPQGQRNVGRGAEMRQRATMQTNTADVGPLSLINGCGCLLFSPANNTAARAIYYSMQCAINEV